MAHVKHERWTCDAPGCEASSEKDPMSPFMALRGDTPWRFAFGLYICPKHRIAALIDGAPVEAPKDEPTP